MPAILSFLLLVSTSVLSDSYHDFLVHLGGQRTSLDSYENNVQGFHEFLRASGVRQLTGRQLASPFLSLTTEDRVRKERILRRHCSRENLLPAKSDWHKGAALALLTEKMMSSIQRFIDSHRDQFPQMPERASVFLRNWYRPECYNSRVGGAPSSDHIKSAGIDLDFPTPFLRLLGQRYLCDNLLARDFQGEPLTVSVGVGDKTLHVGLFHRNRRMWSYGRYRHHRLAGNCWGDLRGR